MEGRGTPSINTFSKGLTVHKASTAKFLPRAESSMVQIKSHHRIQRALWRASVTMEKVSTPHTCHWQDGSKNGCVAPWIWNEGSQGAWSGPALVSPHTFFSMMLGSAFRRRRHWPRLCVWCRRCCTHVVVSFASSACNRKSTHLFQPPLSYP